MGFEVQKEKNGDRGTIVFTATLRVLDDGTVTFYREIKLKLGFVLFIVCYYDKIYLQLIDMGGLRLQRALSP